MCRICTHAWITGGWWYTWPHPSINDCSTYQINKQRKGLCTCFLPETLVCEVKGCPTAPKAPLTHLTCGVSCLKPAAEERGGLGPQRRGANERKRRSNKPLLHSLEQWNLASASDVNLSLKLLIIEPLVCLVPPSHCNSSKPIIKVFQAKWVTTVYKAQVLSSGICSLFWRQILKNQMPLWTFGRKKKTLVISHSSI